MTERVSDARLAELATWKPGAGTKALSAQREEWQAMARELLERREAERWIPVTERLPPTGHPVLCKAAGPSKVFAASYMPRGGWMDFNGALRDPAWWREIGPLPAPEGESA